MTFKKNILQKYSKIITLMICIIFLLLIFIFFFPKRVNYRQMCLKINGDYSFLKNECFSTLEETDESDMFSLCELVSGEYDPCVPYKCPVNQNICPLSCISVCSFN